MAGICWTRAGGGAVGACVALGIVAGIGAREAPAQDLRFESVASDVGLAALHLPIQGIGSAIVMSSGGAVGDYDGDGWQDLYVTGGGMLPDRLFINQQDGTFVDEALAWGIADHHLGLGSAAGDYDRDGDLDLYVSSAGGPGGPARHRLYRNNGDRTFTDVAAHAGVATNEGGAGHDGWGAAWGDYDGDGDLDLAVAGYFQQLGGNRLYQNNGDGTFTDVTTSAIPTDMTEISGFCPRFCDMDGDRAPELLWVSDFLGTRYLVNQRDGSFRDRTRSSGTGLDENGMGQAIADFDNDGRLDWFVTAIRHNIADTYVGGSGNKLYMATGTHAFDERAAFLNVRDGGWGWGTLAIDLDLDTDVDLMATNGWANPFDGARAKLWINQHGTFSSSVSTGFDHAGQGRGMAHFDYDRDGDQDVLLFGNTEPLRLFRNEIIPTELVEGATIASHWARVTLDTRSTRLAPNGVGTRVEASVGGVTMVRVVDGATTYLAQSELSAHFGLGDSARIDELRIEWADGSDSVFTDVRADRDLHVSACPAAWNDDGTIDQLDLLAFVGAWLERSSNELDLDLDGNVGIRDLLWFLDSWLGGARCE